MGGRWSSKEDALLKENYSSKSKEELLNILSGRTWAAIANRASKFSLSRDIISSKKRSRTIKKLLKNNEEYRKRTEEARKKATRSSTKSIKKPEMNEDFSYFIGAIAGDGSIHSNGNCVTFFGQKEFSDKIGQLVSDLFDISTRREKRQCGERVVIGSRELNSFLREVCDGELKSKEFTIPEQIMTGSREIKQGFLRGMFDTEGSINFIRTSRTRCVTLNSSNNQAINQIRKLLSEMDIKSVVRKYGMYYLSIERYRSIIKFKGKVSFSPWAIVTKGRHKGEPKRKVLNQMINSYTQGPGFYSKEKREKAREMYKEVKSTVQVANALDVSPSAVQRWASDLIPDENKPTPWTDEEIKILKKKYPEQGYNISELNHPKGSIKKKAIELEVRVNK